MKNHSLFWYIALSFVFAAIAITSIRKTVEAPANSPVTPALIKSFLQQIDKDPQMRRVETRLLVDRLAEAIERGEHSSAEAFYALGLKLREEGRYAEAREALLKSIERKGDWSLSHNALGVVLYRLGLLNEAEKSLRRALELNPAGSRPHNDLAVLLRLQNRLEEAMEHAQAALQLAPNDVATQNNFGNLLVAMGKLGEATEHYKKAIELDPQHPAPYYNLACVSSLQGLYDDALSYLTQAVARDKGYLDEALRDPHLERLRQQPTFVQFAKSLSPASREGSVTGQQ